MLLLEQDASQKEIEKYIFSVVSETIGLTVENSRKDDITAFTNKCINWFNNNWANTNI